jgi:hypothetical protein
MRSCSALAARLAWRSAFSSASLRGFAAKLRADRDKDCPGEGCRKPQDQKQRDADPCKLKDTADVLESDGVIDGGAEQVVKSVGINSS